MGAICERDGDCDESQSCRHDVCGRCADNVAQVGEICFADVAASPAPAEAMDVVAGDIDLDGNVDLLVASQGSQPVSLLRGDGAGAFETSAWSVSAQRLEVVTLDDAGAIGFVAEDCDSGSASLLDAGGQPLATVTTSACATAIAFEPAVGLVRLLPTELVFYEREAQALVERQRLALAAESAFLEGPADVDADGEPEFVVQSGEGLELLNRTDAGLTLEPVAGVEFGGPLLHLLAFDFAGSNAVDLLGATASEVRVFVGDGEGGLTASDTFELAAEPTALAIVDLNFDLENDVVVAGTDGSVNVYLQRGREYDRAPLAMLNEPVGSLVVAFLDEDVVPDIVGVGASEVHVLRGSP